jgi:pilus assembly protein CpaE
LVQDDHHWRRRDFLKAARPNDAQPKLVLNMVGLPKRPEIPPKDFGQAIGIDPSLILPFDAQLFGTAANNGQMVFDVAPESKVSQGIDQLAAELTGKEIQAQKPSMLKKLLGK